MSKDFLSKERLLCYIGQGRSNKRILAGPIVIMTMLAFLLVTTFSVNGGSASAQAACASGDTKYNVVSGDTLSRIAQRYNTTWQNLSDYNKLTNPNLIYVNQTICIPGTNNSDSGSTPPPSNSVNVPTGSSNPFPYGQCTWWASQRYKELNGVYVPWVTNSNAHQWDERAREFGWKVSSTPKVGSIIVIEAWTQGAWDLGHVGVVESIEGNGNVLVSHMNWGGHGSNVIHTTFSTGPGVSFVYH